MVDVFNEAAARREQFRTATGQFGVVPLHPPELEIAPPPVPSAVADIYPKTVVYREGLASLLIAEIDAAMPSQADFVNYEMNLDGTHLVISEALGVYGDELDKEPFAHIEKSLFHLGLPYGDFDGDLVINSFDDYGWERSQPYNLERDQAAREAAASAFERWRQSIVAQQRAVIDSIWPLVDPAVGSLDFSWDTDGQCLRLAAVIHPDGRTDVNGENWPRANELAAYLTAPEHTPMLHNELNGLYRLDRGA